MQNEMNIDPFLKLKTDGDAVEREFADRIQATLPSYARIWAEYVGNDGCANALPMLGASDDAHQSRMKYWQRFYTIFESLALCWDITEQLHHQQEIRSFKPYAQNLNLWIAFYSHLGRIHDMVKAFASELRRPELLNPFDEYWQERHIVLHGPKVPMKWVCNTLAVPQLGNRPKQWNDKMVWSDLVARDFELLADEVSAILTELVERLERCLAELRKTLPTAYGWTRISWDTSAKKPVYDVSQQVQANMSVSAVPRLSLVLLSGTGTNISGAKDV